MGAAGGNVEIEAGSAVAGTKGKILLKDGAGSTVVTVDDTQFKVDAVAAEVEASGALSLTGTSSVTISAGSNTVSITSAVTISAALSVTGTSNVATFEGGVVFGDGSPP